MKNKILKQSLEWLNLIWTCTVLFVISYITFKFWTAPYNNIEGTSPVFQIFTILYTLTIILLPFFTYIMVICTYKEIKNIFKN